MIKIKNLNKKYTPLSILNFKHNVTSAICVLLFFFFQIIIIKQELNKLKLRKIIKR